MIHIDQNVAVRCHIHRNSEIDRNDPSKPTYTPQRTDENNEKAFCTFSDKETFEDLLVKTSSQGHITSSLLDT